MFTYAIRRLLRSLILSFLLTLLMLAGLTFLLYRFHLSESQTMIGIYLIYLVSCLAGGFLSGKVLKTKRFLWGIMTGALYFFVLFLLSSLQENGIQTDLSHILMRFGVCAGSGMVGGMIS